MPSCKTTSQLKTPDMLTLTQIGGWVSHFAPTFSGAGGGGLGRGKNCLGSALIHYSSLVSMFYPGCFQSPPYYKFYFRS